MVWSADNEAYLVPGDGPARRIQRPFAAVEEVHQAAFDSVEDVPVLGLAPADREGLGGPDPTIEGSDRTALFIRPNERRYTYRDVLTHRLGFGQGSQPPIYLDFSAHWLERAVFTLDANGRDYLAGPTGILKLTGAALSEAVPDLHLPRPIFDHSQGLLSGAFDDRRIRGLDGGQALEALAPSLPNDLDYIESVAYASVRRLMAIHLVHTDGSRTLSVAVGGQTVWTKRCPRYPWAAPLSIPASVSIENWGRPGRPLPVRRRHLDELAKGTVIIWDGGPGSTFSAGHSGSLEQQWLSRGYEVAVIDGSGSAGLELGSRLSRDRLGAVREDAAQAAQHIEALGIRAKPLIVQGFSFGAIAAAEMAQAMALNDPARAPGLLLVSPWLRYRSPAEYGQRVPFLRGGLNPVYAERSEQSRFGPLRTPSRDGYVDQMEDWRSTYNYGGPTLILFGAEDAVTRSEDVWPAFQRDDDRLVEVIPAAGHSVFATEGGSAATDRWLEKLSTAAAPTVPPL